MAELNQQKTELENKLAEPSIYSNADEFKKTETAYKQLQEKLITANAKYEKIFEKIMELEETTGQVPIFTTGRLWSQAADFGCLSVAEDITIQSLFFTFLLYKIFKMSFIHTF